MIISTVGCWKRCEICECDIIRTALDYSRAVFFDILSYAVGTSTAEPLDYGSADDAEDV